jgi:hypothetical protein
MRLPCTLRVGRQIKEGDFELHPRCLYAGQVAEKEAIKAATKQQPMVSFLNPTHRPPSP